MPVKLDDFKVIEFPVPKGSLPGRPDSYVYVLCWIGEGAEMPFYVGQTKRLAERMDDYCTALFAASTDFRVGEAVRYFRDSKYRIVIRYKPTMDPRKDESSLIRELVLSGERLLNCLPSYDYSKANEADERAAVKRFCEMLVRSSLPTTQIPRLL